MIVDSGAFAPGDEGANDSFSPAGAHNILLVNGQSPRYEAAGAKTLLPDHCVAIEDNPGLQLAHGGFAFLGVEHHRAWFGLGENAWAVLDRLEGGAPHAVTSLIHYYPTFEIELREDRAIVHSRSLAFSVIPLSGPATGANESSKMGMSCSRGEDPDFPGWYAPEFGVKHPASVLRFEWPRADLPRMCGYVIASGSSLDFVLNEASDRGLVLTLNGKEYRLRFQGGTEAST